jgi:hypothetical protein
MARTINVHQVREAPLTFSVTVEEDGVVTHHEVTMSSSAFARRTDAAPAQVVDAAFRFLLDREAKESILARFDLSTVARYFPEFEQKLPDYFR